MRMGNGMSLPSPFLYRNGRTLVLFGHDVEFVDEAHHAGQAQPQTPGGREPVPEGLLDISNPRAFVVRDHLDTLPARALDPLEPDFTAPGISHDVAGQLGNG